VILMLHRGVEECLVTRLERDHDWRRSGLTQSISEGTACISSGGIPVIGPQIGGSSSSGRDSGVRSLAELPLSTKIVSSEM
jgi:hypothetical protein